MDARTRLDIAAIADRLARRRIEKRLEQTEVAERAGLSRAYISRLEKGIVLNPKLFDLAHVARVLDIPLADLVSPPGRSASRELRITECADILSQLDDEPPEIADTILRWLRESVDIARAARLAREN